MHIQTYTKIQVRVHSIYINTSAHNNTYTFVDIHTRTYALMLEITQAFTRTLF